MNKSLLTKLFKFPATLIHGDTLVLDRWNWIKPRLPVTKNSESLLDVGCGTGAFSIGAALRGYKTLGLSWDERNQDVASYRARLCKAEMAKFEILDVRRLDERSDLQNSFDFVLCLECAEHIIDDRKLFCAMAACLKPGGRLLFTTPYLLYRPISAGDCGPFLTQEEGWHVRRGYSKSMLEELCIESGLVAEHISYCSGMLSQKITALMRFIEHKAHPLIAWGVILPFRILPPIFDRILTKITNYPDYSICLEAYKPRYGNSLKSPG